MPKDHKRANKNNHQLQQANADLINKNRELGNQNEQLKSKVKALEAECGSKKSAIEELENEKATVTIVEQPEDNSLRILDKIYALTQDDRVHKQLTEEERAHSALKLQQQFLEQQHAAARMEQELRNNSPEVVEARHRNEAKRKTYFVCQVVGGMCILAGIGMIVGFSYLNIMSAIIVGAGLFGTGVLLFIVGVVPYLSAEDTVKIEKLSKVFKTTLPLPNDSNKDDLSGQKSE